MPRILVPTLAALLALPFLAAPTSVEAAATSDSPAKLLSRLKRAVARRDRGGEWATLSPFLKERLSRRAGRNVDFADYELYRNETARDPEIRKMERYLRGARLSRISYRRNGRANGTIRLGGPLMFGADVHVRFVLLELWRLEIKGEAQAYWGFSYDKSNVVLEGEDGSYIVQMKDAEGNVTWQQRFAPEQVQRFARFSKWFFDSFGQAEEMLFQ